MSIIGTSLAAKRWWIMCRSYSSQNNLLL